MSRVIHHCGWLLSRAAFPRAFLLGRPGAGEHLRQRLASFSKPAGQPPRDRPTHHYPAQEDELGRPAGAGIHPFLRKPLDFAPRLMGDQTFQETGPFSTMRLSETPLPGHLLPHTRVPFCHGLFLRKVTSAKRNAFYWVKPPSGPKLVNGVACHPFRRLTRKT